MQPCSAIVIRVQQEGFDKSAGESSNYSDLDRPCLFNRELGMMNFYCTKEEVGDWYEVAPFWDNDENQPGAGGGGYGARILKKLPPKCQIEKITKHFCGIGLVLDVEGNFMSIWHDYLGLIIHFGTDLLEKFVPLQPVNFKADVCSGNRFVSFHAVRVTPAKKVRFRNLYYSTDCSIEVRNDFLVAVCSNNDQVILLDRKRALMKAGEFNEGDRVFLVYYRILLPHGPVYVSAFVTNDSYFAEPFEMLCNTRIITDEFNTDFSQSSEVQYSSSELKNICLHHFNCWDANHADITWYKQQDGPRRRESDYTGDCQTIADDETMESKMLASEDCECNTITGKANTKPKLPDVVAETPNKSPINDRLSKNSLKSHVMRRRKPHLDLYKRLELYHKARFVVFENRKGYEIAKLIAQAADARATDIESYLTPTDSQPIPPKSPRDKPRGMRVISSHMSMSTITTGYHPVGGSNDVPPPPLYADTNSSLQLESEKHPVQFHAPPVVVPSAGKSPAKIQNEKEDHRFFTTPEAPLFQQSPNHSPSYKPDCAPLNSSTPVKGSKDRQMPLPSCTFEECKEEQSETVVEEPKAPAPKEGLRMGAIRSTESVSDYLEREMHVVDTPSSFAIRYALSEIVLSSAIRDIIRKRFLGILKVLLEMFESPDIVDISVLNRFGGKFESSSSPQVDRLTMENEVYRLLRTYSQDLWNQIRSRLPFLEDIHYV